MRAPDITPQLNVDTRLCLARLLGMMGSDHDGEALNAARMADRLVRKHGVTWLEVITTPVLPPLSTADPLAQFTSCAEACRFTLARAPTLTQWECKFPRNVAGFSKLSLKQLDTLRRLVTRAIAAGGRP
jgi:hypothetical protein